MRTLIRNARICDGTGARSRNGHILFDEKEILALFHDGEDRRIQADTIIDAYGMTVTPGFVDIHRHCDAIPFRSSSYGDAMLLQGITSTVVGNCGISMTPAPMDEAERNSMYRYYEAVLGPIDERLSFMPRTYRDYLSCLEKVPLPVNTAAMIGTGAVRIAVKGFSDAPFTEQETLAARNLIEDALAAGAPGISLGIMYLPECYGTTKEFARMLEPVGHYGRVITTHIRGEGDSLVESVKEVLEIAEQAGCALEISHFKSCGIRNWGKEIHKAIQLIDEARDRGQDVTCDFYPYDGGSTALTSMLPPAFVAGNLDQALERLGTEEGVKELREALKLEWPGWDNYAISLGWDRVQISGVYLPEYQKLVGLRMTEAAEKYGYPDAVSLAAELMHREEGRTAMIILSMSQEDIDTVAGLPYSLLISDSIYADTETPHPRMYGSFPKFLREYARERKLLSFEQAVHKMTQMPAERMHFSDRGVLKPGFVPDLLLFDPETFSDHATYDSPTRVAAGLHSVFIGGKEVVHKGQVLLRNAGRVLRA